MADISWRARRYAPLIVLGLVFCAVAFVLRVVFVNSGGDHQPVSIAEIALAFLRGLYFDVAAFAYAAVPLALYLLLVPGRIFRHRLHRPLWLAFCWALIFGMLFLFVAEWFFWQEFRTRFNFIAVDYLLYTREVIGNIRQSYPVGQILAILAALAAFIVWMLRARLLEPLNSTQGFGGRLLWALPVLVSPLLAFTWIDRSQRDFSVNPLANELAGDGLYEFFSAAYRNELDYVTHYASLEPAKARSLLRARLETPHSRLSSANPADLARDVRYPREEKRLNVIMISIESLSADFMARFGNPKGLTPRLDALAGEGLFFTQLPRRCSNAVRVPDSEHWSASLSRNTPWRWMFDTPLLHRG